MGERGRGREERKEERGSGMSRVRKCYCFVDGGDLGVLLMCGMIVMTGLECIVDGYRGEEGEDCDMEWHVSWNSTCV